MSNNNVSMPSPVVVQDITGIFNEGDAVKNYKEMCKLLGEDVKNGSSKRAQQKEWKRYFDYERVGQKYIIVEIYDEPLPKDDKRMQNGNIVYLNHIELLLLDYLCKQKGKSADMTVLKMFKLIGMVNDDYMNEDITFEEEEINQFQVNHFYQRTYRKLDRILFGALNNLRNRRLIDYDKVTMVKIDEEQLNGNIETVVRPATELEKDIIRETEKLVLKQFGLESITQVYLKFKRKKFYNVVNNILYSNYNIHLHFKNIALRFTHDHITEALEQTKINMNKRMLNDKVREFVDNQADKNLENNKKGYDEYVLRVTMQEKDNPFNMDTKTYFKYDEDVYIYAQKKLSEYLISIK